MVQRLPNTNGDDGTWGTLLQNYLTKEHYQEGTDPSLVDTVANGMHKTVTIFPGTAAAAPLTFKGTFTNQSSQTTPAALLTTPASGSVEYDGTYFYLTQGGASNVRRKIDAYYDPTTVTGTTYSITATNTVIFVNAASNSITVTLPTAVGFTGYRFYIKRTDATANTVTVAAAGGNIDGSASQPLSLQYQAIMVVSDGTNWYIF